MDLRDSPSQQLRDLIEWLRLRAAADSPPSPQIWEELTLEMREHALFAEAFLLPKVEDPQVYLPGLRVIRGVGLGEALVHPQERIATYVADFSSNGGQTPEPEEVSA